MDRYINTNIKYNPLSKDVYYNITNTWNYIPDELLKYWQFELKNKYLNDIEKMAYDYYRTNNPYWSWYNSDLNNQLKSEILNTFLIVLMVID